MVLGPYLYSFECVKQVGRMGENNGTRLSPTGEPEIAEIEPSKEVEQINDPSHPIDQHGMGEQSPVVASDFPVQSGKPLIPRALAVNTQVVLRGL